MTDAAFGPFKTGSKISVLYIIWIRIYWPNVLQLKESLADVNLHTAVEKVYL